MKHATIRYAIASNIKRLMLATPGIRTEIGLAARTDIQQSTLQGILSGAVDVDVDTLDIIAKALDVSARALLAPPSTMDDPISKYLDRIAALPVDQQQRIQDFMNSVSAQHEEQAFT